MACAYNIRNRWCYKYYGKQQGIQCTCSANPDALACKGAALESEARHVGGERKRFGKPASNAHPYLVVVVVV